MLYNGNPDFSLFRQPPTYATFMKTEIDTIRSYPGFATLKFFAAEAQRQAQTNGQEMEFYDSVLAVGYDANDGLINTTVEPILFDSVPCPPECHIMNAANAMATDNDWLSVNEAGLKQQAMPLNKRFSASFSAMEIQGLWMLSGLAKIRAYYASFNGAPTFLVVGVDAAGNNLPGIYLLDPNPVAAASLQ